MFRRSVIAGLLLSVCVASSLWAYQRYLRSYRIAVIHFSDTDWAVWQEAAGETSYSLHRYDRDQLDAIAFENYQLVVIRAMGLNLSDEQVASLDQARQRGTHFWMLLPTNDRSREQSTLSSDQQQRVDDYLKHGGRENVVAMLHYTAREFAGKEVSVPPLVEKPLEGFFHIGSYSLFENIDQYDAFLSEHRPSLSAVAPRVALAGAFLDPRDSINRAFVDYLIQAFESAGIRVYPLYGRDPALQRLESTRPDLVITFPHGRMASDNLAPKVLKRLNCPCVSALSLLSDEVTWREDQRGMEGGYLGQSVTTPEVDGVIEPIVITSVDPNERGVSVRTILADRIEKRVALASNWLKLKRKPNSEKRLVIVYYKAPGLSALAAADLEVVPSLYNTLSRLREEGYDFGDEFPESADELFSLIQQKGKTLGQWAIGAYETFLQEAEPEFVPAREYANWFQNSLSEKRQRETIDLWGPIPGKQMVAQRENQPHLVVSRIKLGNVVLMPQPTVGGGGADEDEVASIHGTNQAVPHFYLGAYLWARYGFGADAIVHFGTHGSLEFTYGKSTALSRDCWPDILIGDVPHIYPYVINNIGEAVVAKRRSGAVIVSHMTAPFTDSGLYGQLSQLHDKLHDWQAAENPELREETAGSIARMVRSLNLDRDLGFESAQADTNASANRDLDNPSTEIPLLDAPLDTAQMEKVHNYIHQLKNQTITDGLHVLGRPLQESQVEATVTQMLSPDAADAVLAAVGLAEHPEPMEFRSELLQSLVLDILQSRVNPAPWRRAAINGDNSSSCNEITASKMTLPSGDDFTAFWSSSSIDSLLRLATAEQRQAFFEVLDQIESYAQSLRASNEAELNEFVSALAAGFISPSSGGDAIGNPASLPTGRNLYAINADMMPSEEAWQVGRRLADDLIAEHLLREGRYPRRVAFSLWGGEFIRGKGTTLAQILYLMGVRPLRNSRAGVYDIEVIPIEELGRPRIDVLVQTSGQFRDIAASRISLMDKAVQMVSQLDEPAEENYVRSGTMEVEVQLKQQGMAPKEARQLATARIFGAANNRSYGTDIMGLVEKGDQWENEQEIADRYVQNMGGIYRDGETWGTYRPGLFEAQMQGTELVVHPRSSNTWGPLSLDHVYEFMGGMSLAVRNKTGRDPVAVFNDLRKPGRAAMVSAESAIREEARTAMWNPKFITAMQREGASAAASLTESVRNMHGWNVMQPEVIQQDMWDETYEVYLQDKHSLGMREYFEQKNPYALQNMTAIMLETARKGYWQPAAEVLRDLAETHAELVHRFGAGCSYETCGNGKLQQFLQRQLTAPGSEVAPEQLAAYRDALSQAIETNVSLPEVEGITMQERIERQQQNEIMPTKKATAQLVGLIIGGSLMALLCGLLLPKQPSREP